MKRVASLGIHIVDVLGRPVSGIPEGQNLAILDEIRVTVAGTAAGTSIDLAKLGMQVLAIGAIGEDELAEFLIGTMSRYGVDTRGLVRKRGVQTSSTMLPIRPNGERPALHVPGANAHLSAEDVDLGMLGDCDYLHVGGTPLMPGIDGKPLAEILRYAQDHKIVTTYDLLAMPHPKLAESVETCLPYVDYFMPGFEEAVMLSGKESVEEVVAYFVDRGATNLVFKRGEAGSVIATRSGGSTRIQSVPAFRVPVVDSTGCGDSFCAGFITGLSMGWPVDKAARLGAACGALVIQGLGSDAGIVDLDQTIAFMESAEVIS